MSFENHHKCGSLYALHDLHLYNYMRDDIDEQQYIIGIDVIGNTTNTYHLFQREQLVPAITDTIYPNADGKIFFTSKKHGPHGANLSWIRIKEYTNKFGGSSYINFGNIEGETTVEESRIYLTKHFGHLNPQILVNYSHFNDQYTSSSDHIEDELASTGINDDGNTEFHEYRGGIFKDITYNKIGGNPNPNLVGQAITIWGASESVCKFKFISDINGQCTIGYGCGWSQSNDTYNTSVSIYLNNTVIHDIGYADGTPPFGPIYHTFDVVIGLSLIHI